MFLNFFSKERLWRELFKREGFSPEEKAETYAIWKNVFYRTPELRAYLKNREISLLKAITLKQVPQDFILGQLAENRMWQKLDVPSGAEKKVEEKKELKLPTVQDFLGKWGKQTNANNSKAEVSTEVASSEGEGA